MDDSVPFTIEKVSGDFFTIRPIGYSNDDMHLRLPEYPISLVSEDQRSLIKEGSKGLMFLSGCPTKFLFGE
jgi:hypothetical protein